MSDLKPTKEQLQIFEKLKEVTEPYYVHSDQMIAIAMWIDAEFELKSKANEANKQPDTKALRLQNVSPSTLLDEYVILCKPNYLAKDGSIKPALVKVSESGCTWLAPKMDLY